MVRARAGCHATASESPVAERPEGRACRPSAAQRSEPRHGDPRKASPPGAKNLRGRVGDRRPSAAAPFTRTPQGRRLPGAGDGRSPASLRTGVQRPDPEAERSGARGRVGTGNGCGNGIGNGCDLAHIYTYIPLPTQHERPLVSSPPDSVRGRRPGGASVCGRARPRVIALSGAHRNSQLVELFTE